MSARTSSLIPFRYKLFTGLAILVVAVALTQGAGNDDGSDPGNEDYGDRDRFRLAGWLVDWQTVGRTRPSLYFRYAVGSTTGTAYEDSGAFSVNGYVTQGYVFTISAGVIDHKKETVSTLVCQALLDGKPIRTEMTGDPSKQIQCTAVATW